MCRDPGVSTSGRLSVGCNLLVRGDGGIRPRPALYTLSLCSVHPVALRPRSASALKLRDRRFVKCILMKSLREESEEA